MGRDFHEQKLGRAESEHVLGDERLGWQRLFKCTRDQVVDLAEAADGCEHETSGEGLFGTRKARQTAMAGGCRLQGLAAAQYGIQKIEGAGARVIGHAR